MKYKITGLVFAVFLATTPFISYGQTSGDVTVTTDKKVYSPGEPVKVMITNNSEEDIFSYVHPGVLSEPMRIQKKLDDDTFKTIDIVGASAPIGATPPIAPILKTFPSGDTFEVVWDQKEYASPTFSLVDGGIYRASASFVSDPNNQEIFPNDLIFYSEEFTISDTAQTDIQSLLALIADLQAQLAELQQSAGQPQGVPGYVFTRNLSVGSSGEDVRQLQIRLNTEGFTISQTGAGSPGNETNFFGELTRQAVVKYQIAEGISPAVGFVGPVTRERLNVKGTTGMTYTVSTDKGSYTTDEPIEIEITAINNSDATETLSSNTTCHAFYMIAPSDDPDSMTYDHKDHVLCGQAFSELEIPPQESHQWSFTHPSDTIPPGSYAVHSNFPGQPVSIIVEQGSIEAKITPDTLPNAQVGTNYSQTLKAENFPEESLTWEIVSGSLPSGLSLMKTPVACLPVWPTDPSCLVVDTFQARIWGTPESDGQYTFTVKATSENQSAVKSYTISVI